MKYLICLLLLALCGCGSGEVLVTYETVDQSFLDSTCNESYTSAGYAVWDETTTPKTCTIYMLPIDDYLHTQDYHRVLGHEVRHCFEGEFH